MHHAHTNHITNGETHVPAVMDAGGAANRLACAQVPLVGGLRPAVCAGQHSLFPSPTVEGIECGGAEGALGVASTLGRTGHGVYNLFLHLVIGWPAYLLWGATGESPAEITRTAHPDLLCRAGPRPWRPR